MTGSGKLTNYINVYRTKTGFVHGCPGNPINMRDLLEVLIEARKKLLFEKRGEFVKHLGIIQEFDSELQLDWDDGAGEEWARISHKEHGIVYMINIKIGIVFARKSFRNEIPKDFFSTYEIAIVNNYNDDEWFVDINKLNQNVPEIDWHASEDAVNPNSFSLNDFYFATV